jgi:hypothetical protein
MSKIEVDAIEPQSGTSLTLGASGDTLTIPSGATLVNNGTASGFFEGISWQSVVTGTTLTTVAGRGYPINTTSNVCTVTLPSSASVGDQIQIVDYAGTFATNNITLTSSLNIEGAAADKILTTNREGVTITYVDATQGWVATSGVNSGDQALDPITYSIDFLVIAGGAGGAGHYAGGGGGAGGYRTSTQSTLDGVAITVTVGDGSSGTYLSKSSNGSNSSISGSGLTTITSAGGGGAGFGNTGSGGEGLAGGSGGGGGGWNYNANWSGGSGNTPSTSPVQGYAGGQGAVSDAPNERGGGGGGGSSAVGANATTNGGASGNGGNGGAGTASSITGSAVTRAGGGGGGANTTAGSGGSGGGGNGATSGVGTAGTVNTGSGGGGTGDTSGSVGGSGGKGVVILSMPDANYSGTTTGSPTVATGVSGKTVLTFTGSGSYTT